MAAVSLRNTLYSKKCFGGEARIPSKHHSIIIKTEPDKEGAANENTPYHRVYKPAINGVVVSTLILQSGLQKLGHDMKILTLSGSGHSFKNGNVTYICSVGAGKVYPDARVALRMKNKLIDELIEWHPDLIHSQSEFSTFMIARRISRKLNIPMIHTYHTLYEEYTHYFSPSKKLGKVMVARPTKRVLNCTQFVIAPTDKVKTMLTGYGIGQKILIVPTGIDLHKFDMPRDKIKLQLLCQKLGIPRGQKVVITVGRLAKEKNMEEIISFMDRLNDPDITLLVVGDGPYRSNLEHFALKTSASERIVFTGMIVPEEVADYYKLGDVFVSASSSETQGLTYMEALAAGVPGPVQKGPVSGQCDRGRRDRLAIFLL